ncbi:MAG: uracil-DNA glycosylase [Firmicutes bacterium]|nr:uracil-DNA glycosylase [Bacillota bacterium]
MFKITRNWYELLQPEFNKDYYKSLSAYLGREYSGYTIYPKPEQVFNALNHVKYSDVKVVIIGQDPYHQPGQAHGLCFSVLDPTPPPPSLVNIFKELESDLGLVPPASGNLTHWARQGVLLLNSVLSVRESNANSHKDKGWEQLTGAIVSLLNQRNDPIVFLLWGRYAKKIGEAVTNPIHKCLYAPHPSPLSAHNGWFGCKHFSKTNEILKTWGKTEINWNLNNYKTEEIK